MTEALLKLSAVDLLAIATALRSARLSPPYSPARLQLVLTRSAAEALSPSIQQLADQGFSPDQIATTIDLIARDRLAQPRFEDAVELVTTGPEARGITNRDTSVVVRDLFANAEASVLVAGFAVYQGQRVFQSLAERMIERPELGVRLFLDIQRGPGDTSVASEMVRRFGERFRLQQWPQDRPLPKVFYDPRSIELGGDKRACLHAKCIIVDLQTVFISSANFTEAAQQRNIEVGLLIHNASLAEQLTRFFDTMLTEGLLCSAF